MLQYLFHFSVGYFSLIVNIPLAIMTAILVDKRFAWRTMLLNGLFSVVLLMLQAGRLNVNFLVYHTNDGRSTLLAPVISGVINGTIYGVSIRHGGSTGGTDFIGAMVHHRHPSYSITHVVFALNCAVAGASYFVYDFNIEPVALCIIYSLLTTTISDQILQGGRHAIKVEMITQNPDEISQAVINQLHHSVTVMKVTGGYSHEEKTMVVCIINKHQLTRMTSIINAFPGTFATVSTVSETLGNFKKVKRE